MTLQELLELSLLGERMVVEKAAIRSKAEVAVLTLAATRKACESAGCSDDEIATARADLGLPARKVAS